MTAAIDRRSFFRLSAVAGSLVLAVPRQALAVIAGPVEDGAAIGLFVRIRPDGRVIIRTPSTEIGQGTSTAIPMIIAEELDVAWDKVTVGMMTGQMREGMEGPLPPGIFYEGAGGSNAVRRSYAPAREVGATIRQLLLAEASAVLGLPLDRLATSEGQVFDRQQPRRRVDYGKLAAGAAVRPLPKGPPPLKSPDQFRIIGTPQPQKEARAVITGQPLYGIDQSMPGMLHAVCLRPEVVDAQIATVDDKAALAVPGVRAVIRLPAIAPGALYDNSPLGAAVAVVAESHWAALKGRDALKVTWTEPALREDSAAMVEAGYARLTGAGAVPVGAAGDAGAAFARAAKVVEARYDAPMVAHATLEPQNTIALVTAERCEIVTPTQRPSLCATTAKAITGLPLDRIKITAVRSGGGFGRRLSADQVAEAVLIAKAMPGVPVKLLWTRECDITTDVYRNGSAQRLRAGLDASGRIVAWQHDVATQARRYRRSDDQSDKGLSEGEVPVFDAPGALVADRAYRYAPIFSAVARGSWRAPGANIHGWTEQCFVDELAEAAGADPFDFRLAMLTGDAVLGNDRDRYSVKRLARVIAELKTRSGWQGRRVGKGGAGSKGRGMAAHFSFGSYVGHVVDVTMGEGGAFSVDRVVSVIDCGLVINPNGVTMQNEGAINDALNTALSLEITLKDGVVQQRNFDSYEMMRMDRAALRIETHILPSDEAPSGMGEPSLPPFAPALCNALYAATGKRIRRLPIRDQLA
ncbi:xanthine dehydrogenase family protein molybdopterin-binding subunit [Novosphingobium flavum]|uniref:Xanthine dehydrogenase family protein molybdopterin-binding subunit n=1 Tax=Novosphingobium flavum TaxID=1778672 RepID=A0A7X1FUB5_9SPHN|nr:molybdopterin cofactor-binding domain-containing protein [Novosphingobium flavum]MBC2667150.1 xanthine dehydrogenase family protein molybdopterin-binding subunit [Novosphingobium flavum]